MASFRHVDVIEVRIWHQQVGAIAYDPGTGAYAFQYTPAWKKKGVELAPIMMPLDGSLQAFVFPQLPKETYMGLPGAMSDALPDHFGNQLINAWMAEHGYRPEQISTLDRLAYMGRRGMGALEFRPSRGGQSRSSAPLKMGELVEAARSAVKGTLGDDHLSAQALNRIISVGTSAGGARAKAVLGWNPVTDDLVSGQFDLPPGYEHWLLKFDGMGPDRELGPSEQYGRIEYAYSQMAGEAGITMSPCRLLHENGRAHFMTRRFDRRGNEKIHVQSLCAMQHMDYNARQLHAYESLFLTAMELRLGDDALTELFRRMAFNVAARNNDDHTKNFAFMLDQGGQWELAPAYDVTFAYDTTNVWLAQHLMSVDGKRDVINRENLLTVAARFSIPGAKAALDQINAAVANWAAHAAAAGVGEGETERITDLHVRL